MQSSIPLLDFPVDYLIGDATGKILNQYGRFPCKIKCGVFAYMVSGHAEATINIEKYKFKEGDAIVVQPGSFLLIHEFSEDALVYYIGFSASFMDKQVYGNKMNLHSLKLRQPYFSLPDDRKKVIKSMIDLMMDASNCEPSMLTLPIMVQVYNIIQQLISDFASDNQPQNRTHSRKQELTQQFSDLVAANYQREHQLSYYADRLHVTLPHLCSTIKDVTGKTAAFFIAETILTDAKSQLKLTDTPVKEIAVSLGFDNVMFFNKYFKTHVGVSPKTYRNG